MMARTNTVANIANPLSESDLLGKLSSPRFKSEIYTEITGQDFVDVAPLQPNGTSCQNTRKAPRYPCQPRCQRWSGFRPADSQADPF